VSLVITFNKNIKQAVMESTRQPPLEANDSCHSDISRVGVRLDEYKTPARDFLEGVFLLMLITPTRTATPPPAAARTSTTTTLPALLDQVTTGVTQLAAEFRVDHHKFQELPQLLKGFGQEGDA
jgi:hypothetical protein